MVCLNRLIAEDFRHTDHTDGLVVRLNAVKMGIRGNDDAEAEAVDGEVKGDIFLAVLEGAGKLPAGVPCYYPINRS